MSSVPWISSESSDPSVETCQGAFWIIWTGRLGFLGGASVWYGCVPSGKLTVCYWKLPLTVDLPTKSVISIVMLVYNNCIWRFPKIGGTWIAVWFISWIILLICGQRHLGNLHICCGPEKGGGTPNIWLFHSFSRGKRTWTMEFWGTPFSDKSNGICVPRIVVFVALGSMVRWGGNPFIHENDHSWNYQQPSKRGITWEIMRMRMRYTTNWIWFLGVCMAIGSQQWMGKMMELDDNHGIFLGYPICRQTQMTSWQHARKSEWLMDLP